LNGLAKRGKVDGKERNKGMSRWEDRKPGRTSSAAFAAARIETKFKKYN